MQTPSEEIRAVIAVNFLAKAILYGSSPDFRMETVGRLTRLHKVPNWPEIDHFYSTDLAPAEAVEAIGTCDAGPNHALTFFAPASEDLDSQLHPLGYTRFGPRLGQNLMCRALIDDVACKQGGVSQDNEISVQAIRPQHTAYAIERDGKSVCAGRMTVASPDAIYMSGMETLPEYHRRGLATTLLHRMHADAVKLGARMSVLCASPMGLPLYQKMGYEIAAAMRSFVPIGSALSTPEETS